MQVRVQTSVKSMEPDSRDLSDIIMPKQFGDQNGGSNVPTFWMTIKEPISVWSENNLTVKGILEHLNVTKDHSDYLWYFTRYILSTSRFIYLQLTTTYKAFNTFMCASKVQ